jgi:major vault protein
MAEKRAQARKILEEARLNKKTSVQESELHKETELITIEIDQVKQMADIESKKFEELVGAIGKETIVSMANVNILEFLHKLIEIINRLVQSFRLSFLRAWD